MALNGLDLTLYIGELLVNRDHITQSLRMAHQVQQATLLIPQIFEAGLRIYVIACDILHRLVEIEQVSFMRGIIAQVALNLRIGDRAYRKRHRDVVGGIPSLIIVDTS